GATAPRSRSVIGRHRTAGAVPPGMSIAGCIPCPLSFVGSTVTTACIGSKRGGTTCCRSPSQGLPDLLAYQPDADSRSSSVTLDLSSDLARFPVGDPVPAAHHRWPLRRGCLAAALAFPRRGPNDCHGLAPRCARVVRHPSRLSAATTSPTRERRQPTWAGRSLSWVT